MRCRWIGAALWAVSMAVSAQDAASPATPPPLVDTGTPSSGPASPSAASTQGASAAAPAVARRPHQRRAPPSTPSPITDHLALSALYFWGRASTTGRFDSGTGVEGTPFSAEPDLGVSNQAREPLVELMFRLEQRSRLRLDFLDLRRDGQTTLGGSLQYGDQLFQKGQLLQSQLNWRETDFTYTYSFLRTDRVELGIGAGLHLIQAYASAQVPQTALREVYSAAGPFATGALDGIWRIARRWSLNARGQYLRLAIDSSSGMLADYHADLQYRPLANFAIGAGYEYRRAQVDIRNSNPSGFVQLNISGPELFVRASL